MRASGARKVLGLGLLLLLSCSRHVTLDRSELSDIHRLAVVVRVFGGPSVGLAEGRLPPGKSQAGLQKSLRAAVSDFELAERVRASITQHLPELPPFTDLAPAVQVDSALGDLLTVERPLKKPEFGELSRIHVDGVLYVELEDWGVNEEDGKGQYFLSGYGRMFTLRGDSTVWRAPLSEKGPEGGLPKGWSDAYEIRAQLGELANRAGQVIALDLGGTPEPRHTSAELPDIPDEGHPPEKLEKIIPFVYEVDAGPVDAGPSVKPVSAVPDAGDPLFPGPLPR